MWELKNFTEANKGYLQICFNGVRVADVFPYAAKTDPVFVKEQAQRIVDVMNESDSCRMATGRHSAAPSAVPSPSKTGSAT